MMRILPVKFLSLLLMLTVLLGCSEHNIEIEEWKMEILQPNPMLSFSKEITYDVSLKSNFVEFEFPEVYCDIEKTNVKPKIRIYDMCFNDEEPDNQKVSEVLYSSSKQQYTVLKHSMQPSEHGKKFRHVIKDEGTRYIFDYFLKKINSKYVLFEYKSTYGTNRMHRGELFDLMEQVICH